MPCQGVLPHALYMWSASCTRSDGDLLCSCFFSFLLVHALPSAPEPSVQSGHGMLALHVYMWSDPCTQQWRSFLLLFLETFLAPWTCAGLPRAQEPAVQSHHGHGIEQVSVRVRAPPSEASAEDHDAGKGRGPGGGVETEGVLPVLRCIAAVLASESPSSGYGTAAGKRIGARIRHRHPFII